MENSDSTPGILTRLFRERIELAEYSALAKKGLGVLTLKEVNENFCYWEERMKLLYEKMGWDSNLVNLLDNNQLLFCRR